MRGHAGIFERYAAMVADALALKIEWQVPEGGVGSVFARDYDMVRAADRVLAFFAPDSIMQGGTGHVVEAAMASESQQKHGFWPMTVSWSGSEAIHSRREGRLMPMYAIKVPIPVLDETRRWMREWARSWRQEVPMTLHSHEVDPNGAPQWHPEFARYLTDPDYRRANYGSDNKIKTTRAFRQLRKVCPREYEVLYRLVVLSQNTSEVATWLTERAIRNGKPQRYDESAVALIAYSAADKVMHWW